VHHLDDAIRAGRDLLDLNGRLSGLDELAIDRPEEFGLVRRKEVAVIAPDDVLDGFDTEDIDELPIRAEEPAVRVLPEDCRRSDFYRLSQNAAIVDAGDPSNGLGRGTHQTPGSWR
jgi:hypothetical protein